MDAYPHDDAAVAASFLVLIGFPPLDNLHPMAAQWSCGTMLEWWCSGTVEQRSTVVMKQWREDKETSG
jgi:hypothetical protein